MVSRHPYGYTPFSYDITDLVVCDGETENVIAVRAENRIDNMQGTVSYTHLLVGEVEDEFDIEVEEREAAKIKTVQEALDYIATLTEE